jgi:hypothetical protein
MAVLIKRRRIEIVAFERQRITVTSTPMLCSVCQLPGEFLTPMQACRLTQVRPQSIYRWLASGKVHGLRTAGGGHRICRNSLFRPFQIPHSPAVPYEQRQRLLSDSP